MMMDEPFHSPPYKAFARRVEQNALLVSMFLMLTVRLRIFLQASGETTRQFGLPFPVVSDNDEWQTMLENHIDNFEVMWDRFIGERADEEIRMSMHRFLFEVLVARTVDAFDTYLSDMLEYIFAAHPEHLNDDDREQLDGLTGNDRDAKVHDLAERRAGRLIGDGLETVMKYLNNKMLLRISTKDELYRDANEYINVRHLIVHTDLKITPLFIERTGHVEFEKGQSFPLDKEYAHERTDRFWSFVATLDITLIDRLNRFEDERQQ